MKKLFITVLMLSLPLFASAIVIELPASQDAYVYDQQPATNFNDQNLQAGFFTSNTQNEKRIFIEFDLPDEMIGSSDVMEAILSLWCSSAVGPGEDDYLANSASNSWSENTITWNNQPGHSNDDESAEAVTGQWIEFDITYIVQEWALNDDFNNGIVITRHNNDPDIQYAFFSSSENSVVINRPVLTIDYDYDPPFCTIDNETLDFGTVEQNMPVIRTFTICNTGGGLLVGTVSEDCPAFSIITAVDYSLEHLQCLSFDVQMQSTTPGPLQCTLDTGVTCNEVTCTGTVDVAPDCALNPASLDFGTTQPGVAVVRTFTITNSGGGTLSGTVTEECASYTITSGAAYSLTSDQSQTVTVAFQAAATGSYPCTLVTGSSCADLACTAAVDLLPSCSVDPVALDFGTVLPNVPVTRTFTISNTGGGTLSGSVTEGCATYSVTAPTTYSLTAGQSYTFTVTFQSATAGAFPCTLDTGGDCNNVTCTGAVELAPACAVTPTTLDFGTVLPNTIVDLTFTISNSGGGTLSGTASADCGGFFTILSGANYSLTVGQSQVVTVRFQSDVVGENLCTLDAGASCGDVSLSGTVELAPACSVTPTTLDFGTVLANTAVTRTFTISNTGGGTLSGTVVESCPAFSILSGAAYSLTAGQSQTVTVQFQSATPGPQVCSLDTGGSCTDVAATGAVLSISVDSGPESACGFVDVLGHLPGATTGYVIDWDDELIGLAITPAPSAGVTVSILVNDVNAYSSQATATWRPLAGFLPPYLGQNIELYFQVSDGVNTWNSNGSTCLWDLTFLTVTQQSMPKAFALCEPAPNPFNPVTRLRLEIPAPDQVSLTVVDLQGRHVDTLFQGPLATGTHEITWQPRNVASGSYFIVAAGRQDRQIQRVLFLK